MKTLALLLLISAGSLAVTVERPELRSVRRRRRLATLAVALVILAGLLYPEYIRWRRAAYDQGAVELLRSLHKAEVQHHKAHGTYLPLDKESRGLSPVEGVSSRATPTPAARATRNLHRCPADVARASLHTDASGYLTAMPQAREDARGAGAGARKGGEGAPDATAWVRLSEALAVTGAMPGASAARRAWNLTTAPGGFSAVPSSTAGRVAGTGNRAGSLLVARAWRKTTPMLCSWATPTGVDATEGRQSIAKLPGAPPAPVPGSALPRCWRRGEVKEAAQAYLYVVLSAMRRTHRMPGSTRHRPR